MEEQATGWGPGFEYLVAALYGRPCPVPFQLHGPLVIGESVFYIRDGALVSAENAGDMAELELDDEAVRLSVIDGKLSEVYEGAEDLIAIWRHFDHVLGHDVVIRLDFAVGSMYMLLSTSCLFAREVLDDGPAVFDEHATTRERQAEVQPADIPVDAISDGVRSIVKEFDLANLKGQCAGHSGTCPEIPRRRVNFADLVKAQALIAIDGPPEKICEYAARLAPSQVVGVCLICHAWVTHADEQARRGRARSPKPTEAPRRPLTRGNHERSNLLRLAEGKPRAVSPTRNPRSDQPSKQFWPQVVMLPDRPREDAGLGMYRAKPFDRRIMDPSVKFIRSRQWGQAMADASLARTGGRVYA